MFYLSPAPSFTIFNGSFHFEMQGFFYSSKCISPLSFCSPGIGYIAQFILPLIAHFLSILEKGKEIGQAHLKTGLPGNQQEVLLFQVAQKGNKTKPQAASPSICFEVKGWEENNSLLICILEFLSGFNKWQQAQKNLPHLAMDFPITSFLLVSSFASLYSFCIRTHGGSTWSSRLYWGRPICKKLLLLEVLQEWFASSPLPLTFASHLAIANPEQSLGHPLADFPGQKSELLLLHQAGNSVVILLKYIFRFHS